VTVLLATSKRNRCRAKLEVASCQLPTGHDGKHRWENKWTLIEWSRRPFLFEARCDVRVHAGSANGSREPMCAQSAPWADGAHSTADDPAHVSSVVDGGGEP